MKLPLLLFLVVSVHLSCAAKLKLPSYITACHKKDPNFDKCCLDQTRNAVPHLLKGEKKYGVPSFLPLMLEKVTLNNRGSLNVELTKIQITGFEDLVIKDIKFDLNAKKIHLVLAIEKVTVISKYTMHGQILVVPLEGNGDSTIILDGTEFVIDLSYHLTTIDKDEHIEFSDADSKSLNFTAKKAKFDFTNLFNGNEQLGNGTNQILNEEWEKVLDEIKPTISESILTVAYTIINNVSKKVPYKFIFPD